MRWTRQHYAGTSHLVHLLGKMLKSGQYVLADFSVLLNAVPAPVTADEQRRSNYVTRGVLEVLAIVKERPTPTLPLVSEQTDLKWYEEIITARRMNFDEYELYADLCVAQHNDLAKSENR
jgi:hypothetical protein